MERSIRLGIFVLLSLGVLVWITFLLGNAESRFQATYRLRATFDNVSGLEPGAEVRLGGLHAGTVRKIQLPDKPGGELTVVMDLSASTRNLVRQDSVALINAEGLVGNKYVEVSFGSEEAAPLARDGTIASAPPIDISDLIAKADQILDTTQGSLDNLQTATSDLSRVAKKVNAGQGTLGALINDKSVYQQASGAVAALHQDADALKHNFLLRGYFNKRGFAEPTEIQNHSIAKLPQLSPEKTFVYDPEQIFAGLDSAKLKNQKSLNEAGAYLQANPSVTAVIDASAGPKGESEQDLQLSQSRAEAVRRYLLEHYKLEDRHLKIIGEGKTEAEASFRILVYSS